MLKVTNSTMNHFETICRGRFAEISALQQSHRKASEGSIPGNTDTEDSAADNDKVVLFLR